MSREYGSKPFSFGDREVEVFHPVGLEEDYGALLTGMQSMARFEPALSSIVGKNVGPGTFFLDVGAQIGLFSIYASTLGADVISLEMRPNVVHCHFETKAKAGITNWLPLPFAAGDAVSRIPISDHKQFALIGAASEAAPVEAYVTCVPVDALGLERMPAGKKSFVKVDVEGFEVLVLRGMQNFIRTTRPVLAIECHPHAAYAYGTNINQIRQLLPENYELHLIGDHRGSGTVDNQELVGEFPHDDNYMVIAKPAEATFEW